MNLGTSTAGDVPLLHFGGQCISRGLEDFLFSLGPLEWPTGEWTTYTITWTTSLQLLDSGFGDIEQSLLLVSIQLSPLVDCDVPISKR